MNLAGRENHGIPAMHPVTAMPGYNTGTTGQYPEDFHHVMNMSTVGDVVLGGFGKFEISNKR
jgi:hypothetical protein